jgi:hypothetical protein
MCLNLSLKHLIVLCWWNFIKHFTPCFEQTPQGPFGQSQQLSNSPSTVLISSTSNSLMSASVKPSTQQIGAIGTKGAGPYQQSALPSAPQASQVCAGVVCAFAHYSLHQTVVPHCYSWLPKKCSVTVCSWDSAPLIIYVVLECLHFELLHDGEETSNLNTAFDMTCWKFRCIQLLLKFDYVLPGQLYPVSLLLGDYFFQTVIYSDLVMC